MGFRIISIISLMVIVPLATAHICFECTGGHLNGATARVKEDLKDFTTNPSCVNDIHSLNTNCTTLAGAFCSKNVETLKGKVGNDEVVLTIVSRGCVDRAKPKRQCKHYDTGTTIIPGFTAVMEKCVCEGLMCNGQTTIAPTVATCLLSLVLAVYAMF